MHFGVAGYACRPTHSTLFFIGIMNRVLLVVRSRANKSIELSRGVVTAPAYGENKRFLGVDLVKKVIVTARDGGNVESNLCSGGVSSLVGGS